MFEKSKQRKREAEHTAALAAWQKINDEIEEALAFYGDYQKQTVEGFLLKSDEELYAAVTQCGLMELRTKDGVSKMTGVDYGRLVVTSRRIDFQGSSRSIECLFSKLIGVQYASDRITVSVSNRQKPLVAFVGSQSIAVVRRRVEHAIASHRGTQFEHEAALRAELAAHQGRRPVLVR